MNNITANNYYNFGPNNGVNQRPARVGHLNAVINALNQGGSGGVTWGSITGTLALQTDLQLALDNKVDKNAAIVAATKTKISYDAKGLITSGADATTADIAASTNKNYVTDAQLTVIGNTSGTNSGNQTLANTSDATSHTTTLSATGGSVQLVEGSGITLTTTGTTADGIITIASTGGTPSGIAGAVQFSNGSAFASDATNFFWDDTNNRLGLGINVPLARLHIKGTGTTGTSSPLRVVNSASAELLYVADDGFIGINTASPTAALSVINNQDNSGGGFYNLDVRNLNANGQARINFKENTAGANRAYITYGNTENILRIATTGSANPIYFGIADDPKLIIGSGGNVGVGITAPTSKLHVKGTGTTSATSSLNVTDSSDNSILFVRNDGYVAVNNTTPVAGIPLTINSVSGGGLSFQTGGSTKTYFVLESSTNGWMAGSSVGDLVLRHANSTNILIGYSTGANIRVTPNGATFIAGLPNTVNNGALNLGDGLFNGAANSFSGVAAGTALAMNFLVGATSDFINLEKTGLARFKVTHDGNVGVGIDSPTAKIQVKGSGATSATNSILVQNSSSNQTFSVRDDGVVFVGLGGLLSGSVKFQVKDQSDNVCLAVSQSDTVFGNSTVLRSMDGVLYPTGNIIFRNGNPNSAIINFGDSEVNSASATGVFSFIKFTRNWTSVAPSLNLTINVQETNNVINMTNGTGTKIFRGIYHNPTVTAVTSHRAFESSSGGGYFNTTSVDASAVLQADSTTQGFLPPRMTNAQRAAIVSPAEGLLVHNTTNKGTAYYDGTNWGYLNGAAQTIAGSGGTVDIPFASGNIIDLTLTASTTLTFSGNVVGVYILKVIQGGTGSYTLTYPASVKWSGGTPPTLTTTVGKTDIITLFHDGTNFFGTYSLNY